MTKIHKKIDPRYVLENLSLVKTQCLRNVNSLQEQTMCLIKGGHSSGALFFLITELEEIAKYHMLDKLEFVVDELNALLDHGLKAERLVNIINNNNKDSDNQISLDDTNWLKGALPEMREDSIYVRLSPHKTIKDYPMAPIGVAWEEQAQKFIDKMGKIISKANSVEMKGVNEKSQIVSEEIETTPEECCVLPKEELINDGNDEK